MAVPIRFNRSEAEQRVSSISENRATYSVRPARRVVYDGECWTPKQLLASAIVMICALGLLAWLFFRG